MDRKYVRLVERHSRLGKGTHATRRTYLCNGPEDNQSNEIRDMG
jgi:hypothetical protein